MESLTTGAACPTAVKRRFDFCIRPFVKPEFRTDPDTNVLSPVKAIEKYGTLSGVPNLWDFQIVKPEIQNIVKSSGEAEYQMRLMTFKEKHMNYTDTEVAWKLIKTCDTHEMLNYSIETAKHHKMIQSYVVDTNTTLNTTIILCDKCNNVSEACSCEVKPEWGLTMDWTKIASGYTTWFWNTLYVLPNKLFFSSWTAGIMNIIFSRYLIRYYRSQQQYFAAFWVAILVTIAFIWEIFPNSLAIFLSIFVFYYAICVFTTIIKKTRDRAFDEILKSTYDYTQYIQIIYDYRVRCAGVICVALYGLYKFYKLYKQGVMIQSALDPKNESEKNDRLKTDNPWADIVVTDLPVTNQCKTMTASQMENAVLNNLVYVQWYEGNFRKYCDGFFVTSNYVLLPNHMAPKDKDVMVEFIRGDRSVINTSFKSYCNFAHAVTIPNTDFMLVQVQSAPSFRSCIDMLPVDKDGMAHVIAELWRDVDGSIKRDSYSAYHSMVSNNAMVDGKPIQFVGSYHKATRRTHDGRCMAILIAHARTPYIHGFHLGGDDYYQAVSGMVTRDQINLALRSMKFVLPEAASGDMPKTICGVNILTNNCVHKKCCTRFLPKELDNTVEVYGSTVGASTPHSDVVPTIISDTVAKVTGVENKWGKPPFNAVRDHSRALTIAANNCIGFKPSALEWSIDDYVNPLIARFKELDCDIRPLTHMETINGIPGMRFVDKIVRNTSIGFPRSGKKNQYMIPLPPDDTWSDPVDLDDVTMEEVNRMISCYEKGVRAYSPAKTSLKDEPTKLTKDKCRIFYVTNAALQYLVRKYYLTICAAYSTVPLLSNCAVGINRQGPEWEEMMNYVREHGDSQILAGDYSSFDLNMPCQMVRAAFEVHMRVAKAFGYSDYDVKIMSGLAADLCNPVIAWNGTLLQLGSLHMSGNNLTVYNGSIVNNLYLRCHYFDQGHSAIPFRSNVNILAYGDDIIGSVSPNIDNFDHITFRDYLKRHGMKFTMPDKESEATKFMHIDKTDFLKCINRYDPHLKRNVAQLSEESIFKSLHSVLQSKFLSKKEIAATNIDGALREWFFHGKDKYELRRSQMHEVAKEHDLLVHCKELNKSFDDKVQQWRDTYES
jgi:hypothetical protein